MRILAINSDPHIQETLVQLQLREPRDVIALAQTPKDALTEIDTNSYDIVLIQDRMAQRDNAALIPALRANTRAQSAPIVVLADDGNPQADYAGTDPACLTRTIRFPQPLDALQDRIAEVCAPEETQPPANVIAFDTPIPLGAPLEIYDAPGIVARQTLETYIQQVPRQTLYASSCFGLAVRDIQAYHTALGSFEFHSLMNDIAETIADEIADTSALFAYVGDGVFVGFVETTTAAHAQRIMRHVNTRLEQADLANDDGTPLDIRVSSGEPLTFTWRSAKSSEAVIDEAKSLAMTARTDHAKLRGQFWFLDRTA